MHKWDVLYENADSDDPVKWIGTITANTGGEALQRASEFWEVPSYDLVVKQKTPSSDYYLEGLARILDPQQGFYNCRCGWSGSELWYVGITYHALDTALPQGQGVCPQCHQPFQGCVHDEKGDH